MRRCVGDSLLVVFRFGFGKQIRIRDTAPLRFRPNCHQNRVRLCKCRFLIALGRVLLLRRRVVWFSCFGRFFLP